MYNKVILAGGNGYLGQLFAAHYKNLANEVIILSRKYEMQNENIKTVVWDGINEDDWASALEGAELLINLCGKNVNCRYTQENRKEIINSRVVTTRLIGNVIRTLVKPAQTLD